MTMLKIVALIVISLYAIPSAYADSRCRTDSFGNTNCTNDYGNTIRGRTDSFGNSTFTDEYGNSVRGRTDSFGNTTLTDDSGNTTRGRKDSFGGIGKPIAFL
jgi:hypothetical protein